MKDIELRFGPVQKKAAKLAWLIVGFMKIGITDDKGMRLTARCNGRLLTWLAAALSGMQLSRANVDYGTISDKPFPLPTVPRLYFLRWIIAHLIQISRYYSGVFMHDFIVEGVQRGPGLNPGHPTVFLYFKCTEWRLLLHSFCTRSSATWKQLC